MKKKPLVAAFATLVLAAGTSAALPSVGSTRPSVSIRDGWDRETTLEGHRGKVTLVVYEDKGSATINHNTLAGDRERHLREAAKQSLEREGKAEEEALRRKVTEQLEGKLRDLKEELDGAVNRVTGTALKQRAAELGQVEEVHEEQNGSITIISRAGRTAGEPRNARLHAVDTGAGRRSERLTACDEPPELPAHPGDGSRSLGDLRVLRDEVGILGDERVEAVCDRTDLGLDGGDTGADAADVLVPAVREPVETGRARVELGESAGDAVDARRVLGDPVGVRRGAVRGIRRRSRLRPLLQCAPRTAPLIAAHLRGHHPSSRDGGVSLRAGCRR